MPFVREQASHKSYLGDEVSQRIKNVLDKISTDEKQAVLANKAYIVSLEDEIADANRNIFALKE